MNTSRNRGFTLIELVVVITILGILAAFAVPKFIALDGQARAATIQGLAGSVRSAAALARGLSMATGASASVTMEGTTVNLVNNYPDSSLTGIAASVNSNNGASGDFTFTAGGPPSTGPATWTKNGAPTPATCVVNYTPAAAGAAPAVTVEHGRLLTQPTGPQAGHTPARSSPMSRRTRKPCANPGPGGLHARRARGRDDDRRRARGDHRPEVLHAADLLGARLRRRAGRGAAPDTEGRRHHRLPGAAHASAPAATSPRQQAASGNACLASDNTWTTPVLGSDGTALQGSAPASTTASPTGVYQFDTQGRLASSPGTTITVGARTITIDAGTGFVQVQ